MLMICKRRNSLRFWISMLEYFLTWMLSLKSISMNLKMLANYKDCLIKTRMLFSKISHSLLKIIYALITMSKTVSNQVSHLVSIHSNGTRSLPIFSKCTIKFLKKGLSKWKLKFLFILVQLLLKTVEFTWLVDVINVEINIWKSAIDTMRFLQL